MVTASLPYRRILPAKEDRKPRFSCRFRGYGMNFACAERDGRGCAEEDGFTRRARFQAKLNMKLRDRSGSWGVSFAGDSALCELSEAHVLPRNAMCGA